MKNQSPGGFLSSMDEDTEQGTVTDVRDQAKDNLKPPGGGDNSP